MQAGRVARTDVLVLVPLTIAGHLASACWEQSIFCVHLHQQPAMMCRGSALHSMTDTQQLFISAEATFVTMPWHASLQRRLHTLRMPLQALCHGCC